MATGLIDVGRSAASKKKVVVVVVVVVVMLGVAVVLLVDTVANASVMILVSGNIV